MKLKKKTAMIVSLALGTLLVATTALADIANKSGYDQLKDGLKETATQCSEKLNSYTMDYSYALKDNGKTLSSDTGTQKYDRSKNASENVTTSSGVQSNGKFYNYSDSTAITTWHDNDPTYYVFEYSEENKPETTGFTNPFKQGRAEDVEKIADALVGSLKDNVVVTTNADGSKDLVGSLTEVQIPSLINAVISFESKQYFSGNQGQNNQFPILTKDIFIKEVKGTAKLNKDGLMEDILVTAILSGKDEQGTVHDISYEVLAKLSGINSTTVTKPDLTAKKVETTTAENNKSGPNISHPEKFIGKYKNSILIEKDNKIIKAGERFVEITQVDNEKVVGRYYEVYKPGFEEYATSKADFNIDAKKADAKYGSGYDFTTESGITGNIYMDQYQGMVNLNLNNKYSVISTGGLQPDYRFSPDLE